MPETLTIGSLFSGIPVGGLEMGLERAGLGPVLWQAESDPYCQRVLAKRWPEAKRYDDVRDINGETERVDLICGGFPCTDISNAGKRAGMAGEHSGLWREYARIIRELRPRVVVVENVSALLGRGFGDVLGDMAACGYDAQWDCIPAAAVGAPHRRDRVFIIAYANGDGLRAESKQQPRVGVPAEPHAHVTARVVADANGCRRQGSDEILAGQPVPHGCCEGVAVADTIRSRCEALHPSVADADSSRQLQQGGVVGDLRRRPGHGGEEPRFQWSVEPDVGGTLDGVPTRLDGGGVNGETSENLSDEVLRYVQDPAVAQALEWATRGLQLVHAEEVLLAFVREYSSGGRLSREQLARPQASGDLLRAMRGSRGADRSSLRREPQQQRGGEHPDIVRELSRLVASRGPSPWSNPLWEGGIHRAMPGVPARSHRLRALGNAVVPQVAEVIGRVVRAAMDKL